MQRNLVSFGFKSLFSSITVKPVKEIVHQLLGNTITDPETRNKHNDKYLLGSKLFKIQCKFLQAEERLTYGFSNGLNIHRSF